MNHGTTTAYKRGCRCDDCALEHYRYRKAYARRAGETKIAGRAVITVPQLVPADECIRHLWALVDSGWTMTQIADEVGMGRNHLWNIRAGKFARLRPESVERILSLLPLTGDDGVDPVVVDRLVVGYPDLDWRVLGATRAERLAAFERMDYRDARRRLRDLGYADQQIELPGSERVRNYLGLRSADVARRDGAA